MEQLIQKVKDLYNNEKFEELLQSLSSEDWKQSAELAYWKGMAEFKLRNISMSISALDTAIQLNNTNPDWYSDRAMVKFWDGSKHDPIPDLDTAVSIQPEYSYRYGFRAFVKQKLGMHEEAIEDYEMALALDPDDEICRNNLELARQEFGHKQAREQNLKIRKQMEEDKLQQAIREGGMESKEFLEFEHKMKRAFGKIEGKEPEFKDDSSKFQETHSEEKHKTSNHSSEQRQGLTPSNIWWVIKRVFTNKEERSAFFNWITASKRKK